MPRNVDRNPPQHRNDHSREYLETDPGQDTHLPSNQSASDSLTGEPSNIPTSASYLDMNRSAVIHITFRNSMAKNILERISTRHLEQGSFRDGYHGIRIH